MKKGQTFSLDLLIAVFIFILVIALFVTVVIPDNSTTQLRNDADNIFASFDSNANPLGRGIIDNNVVRKNELEQLIQEDYDSIKSELGVSGDFCILLIDDEGSIISMGQVDGNDVYTFGPQTGAVTPAESIIC